MSEILPLRPYQQAAITSIRQAWDSGIRRPAVVLPTGAGKTVIFAHLAKMMHQETGARSLVLVHTTELVEQAVRKFHDVAPHLNVGVVKAERDEHADADIIVATVQTLRVERRRAALSNIGIVTVDECHHATAVSYQSVLRHFGCLTDDTMCDECVSGDEDPAPWCDCRDDETCTGPCRRRAHDPTRCPVNGNALAVGFTATLARGDGAALGEVWQKVVYRRDIVDMISAKHLLPIRGKRVKVPDLDFSKVKKTHGDYQADDLAEALTDSLAPELVAKAYVEHASGRSGILFAPTVDSAYVFAEAMQGVGISCETVHGALPREERALILKRFSTGETQVVSNCMVLTEGFDEPRASCAVVCRPTTSAPLYTQMVGRVLRPYLGQSEALLLDVVGVTGRHRLASLVDLLGDNTKELHKDVESLADMLLTADGLELEEESHGTRIPIQFQEADAYEVIEVDLFARSHSAWLQTTAGTWFLPAGKHTVFLAPSGGVGRWNVAVTGPGVREFRYRRISLDAAMTWGEEVAIEVSGNRALTNKKASWRKRDAMPTEAQIAMARRLRIKHDPFITKGELSDLISTRLASQAIDPQVALWIQP